MLILGIKTGAFTTEIIFLENEKILSYLAYKSKNDEAEKLMPLLLKLTKKHKVHLTDIKKVYVIKGPGSFTGLRVGVTIANTIAYLNKAKLYALNTFDYWWALFKSLGIAEQKQKIALLLFAGSQGVYLSEKPGQLGKLIDLSELKSHLQKQKITQLFGDISPEQKTFLEEFNFLKIKPNLATVIQKAKFTQAKIVQPLYLKQPNITKKNNALHRLNPNR